MNLQSIIFFKKFLNNSLPLSIKDILKKRNIRRINMRSNIRASPLEFPEAPKNSSTELCIRYFIPKLLDGSFPDEILHKIPLLSINCLKSLCKHYFFSQYNFVCDGTNCFPCSSRFS